MKTLIEKFMNTDFIVIHNEHNGIHYVISYRKDKKKIISAYKTDNEHYAHLRFMQIVFYL